MDEIFHAYPIFLNLRDKTCLVVGGGRVAERRVRRLLESGTSITVVSPEATPAIRRHHAKGELTYIARAYRRGDLEGRALVILATNDESVHRQVLEDRRRDGEAVLVNDAMRHDRGDFIVPALHREGALSVAVATGGLMPTLASAVAAEVGRLLGATAAGLLRRYHSWRGSVTGRAGNGTEAARALRRAVDRRLLEALRSGDFSRASETIKRAEKLSLVSPAGSKRHSPDPSQRPTPHRASPGTVYLVGAGPGDPELLTVKGRELIRRAEVVVYDRLIDAELLDIAPPWAERLPVGKAPGRHALTQDEINRLLKELAEEYAVVVRLKGGDPYVFGRGGEEAEFLSSEGVPFQVVPGVSSAVAVAAYAGISAANGCAAGAGIPLTHRSCASSFAVVTGHPAGSGSGDAARPIAVPEADTLVYLMGLKNLPAIVEALLRRGKAPDTPVAVVSMGTTVRQQTVAATLEAVVEEVLRAGLRPPAVIVVGEVVRYADRLEWFRSGGAKAFPVDEAPLAEENDIPKAAEPARAG